MTAVAARIAIHAGILAGYVLLAVVHTYPLVRHLDTHLPGQGLGDNASFLWNTWWMRLALASPHEYFWNALIAAPIGASLALHTHSALSAVLGATVLAPLPLVRAHNLVLLASLALNGFAAYALVHLVTRARAASVLAGALFLVAPTIAARLMGHYNLVVAWPLVFACAAAVAWWQRPTIGRAILLDSLIEASVFREWVVNVGRRDARTRIAHLLCELAVRLNAAGLADGPEFEFPLTQEQLADATGLTAVHTNRTLQTLRKDGLIKLTAHRLTILDWDALADFGDFSERYLHHSA